MREKKSNVLQFIELKSDIINIKLILTTKQ